MPLPLESLAWPTQAGVGGPSPGSRCAPSYLLYHAIAAVSLCLPETGISWKAGVVLFLTKPGKSFQAFCTGRIFKSCVLGAGGDALPTLPVKSEDLGFRGLGVHPGFAFYWLCGFGQVT